MTLRGPSLFVLLPVFSLGSGVLAGQTSFVNPTNGHEYFLTPSPMSWQDAQALSRQAGGYLASISDQAENDWIVLTFRPLMDPPDYLWIGLSDQAIEGSFVWDSGEPVSYTNWFPGEPNNVATSPEGEDFVTLTPQDGTGRWFDAPSPTYQGNPYLLYGVIEVVPSPGACSLFLAAATLGTRRRR